MIIDLDQYKILAGITSTTQDDRIEALIPVVQDDVNAICNYDFSVENDWPVGMQIYVVQMIGYLLATLGGTIGVKSETQGGYSYTLGDIGVNGYPVNIEKGLAKWSRVSVKNPQIKSQFRDRRTLALESIAKGEVIYSEPGVPLL